MTAATGIGARVLRTEDKRFLTGTGRYVDDLPLARATYAYFLRSPHAHAKIKSIDTSAAKKMPGVVEIFTGKDTADAKMGGLICGWVVKDKHGQPHKSPPHPVMALDTVRYVGDTVAMVIANSADAARGSIALGIRRLLTMSILVTCAALAKAASTSAFTPISQS